MPASESDGHKADKRPDPFVGNLLIMQRHKKPEVSPDRLFWLVAEDVKVLQAGDRIVPAPDDMIVQNRVTVKFDVGTLAFAIGVPENDVDQWILILKSIMGPYPRAAHHHRRIQAGVLMTWSMQRKRLVKMSCGLSGLMLLVRRPTEVKHESLRSGQM